MEPGLCLAGTRGKSEASALFVSLKALGTVRGTQ